MEMTLIMFVWSCFLVRQCQFFSTIRPNVQDPISVKPEASCPFNPPPAWRSHSASALSLLRVPHVHFINQGCLPIAPSHPSFLKTQFVEHLISTRVCCCFWSKISCTLHLLACLRSTDLRYDLTYLRWKLWMRIKPFDWNKHRRLVLVFMLSWDTLMRENWRKLAIACN